MAPRAASAAAPPSPSQPSESPRRPTGGLTFRQPETEESGWSEPSLLEEDGSPSPSDEPRDELPDDPSAAPRSSSTGSSGGSALSKHTITETARKAVLAAGGAAHQLLARDELEEEVGLYLADEDDAEAIGDPLANMVNRRGGLGAAGNPDLGDAIAALIGLAVYIYKQLARLQAIKRARRNRAATTPAAGPTDPPAADSPWDPANVPQNG